MTAMADLSQLEAQIVPLLHQYKDDINAALLTRYFCLAALVILIVDLAASHADERRLIWTTPRSWAKAGFLTNRYLVPLCIAAAFVPLCGFIGLSLSANECKVYATAIYFLAVCSMGVSNALVVVWVVSLWDNHPAAVFCMIASAIAVWVTSAVAILVALQTQFAFAWSPLLSMCTITRSSSLPIATWAGPLAFELIVLCALVWNALDRPRAAQTPLGHALRADGAIYFAGVAVLRAVQVALVATGGARWFLLMNSIVWALVTVTTNRALFALRRAEEAGAAAPRRVQSPFGLSVRTTSDDFELGGRRHTMPDERRWTLSDETKYRLSDPLPPPTGRFMPIDLMPVIEVDARER